MRFFPDVSLEESSPQDRTRILLIALSVIPLSLATAFLPHPTPTRWVWVWVSAVNADSADRPVRRAPNGSVQRSARGSVSRFPSSATAAELRFRLVHERAELVLHPHLAPLHIQRHILVDRRTSPLHHRGPVGVAS